MQDRVAGNLDPQSAFEAKFSLPYLVSHALLYGAVRLDAFSAERLSDPALRALMQKMEQKADENK